MGGGAQSIRNPALSPLQRGRPRQVRDPVPITGPHGRGWHHPATAHADHIGQGQVIGGGLLAYAVGGAEACLGKGLVKAFRAAGPPTTLAGNSLKCEKPLSPVRPSAQWRWRTPGRRGTGPRPWRASPGGSAPCRHPPPRSRPRPLSPRCNPAPRACVGDFQRFQAASR